MAYVPQSGGGRAPGFDTGSGYILSKPYELAGDPNAAMIAWLNEMLEELYKAVNRAVAQISTNTLDISNILSQIAIINAQIAVLQSGSSGAVGSFLTKTIDVTPVQMQTLNTLPVAWVPAPGAGYYITPIKWEFIQSLGATTFSGGPIMSPRYSGTTTPALVEISISNSANRYLYSWAGTNTSNLGVGSSPDNLPIVLGATSDVTLGSGVFRASLHYVVNPVL